MWCLLGQGAEVNELQSDGTGPLHFASQNGHLEAVHLLLAEGADVHANDSGGYMPLHYACEEGHAEAANAMLEKGRTRMPRPVVDTRSYTGLVGRVMQRWSMRHWRRARTEVA